MWKFSSCEVQGKGHIKTQTPCQDKTKTTFFNNTYVIALADGAGSASLSHYGAACVVDGITELFAGRFEELYGEEDGRQVKLTIMETLNAGLRELAERLDCDLRDLASTMLAVAVREDRFLIAHIGDGVIGYLDGYALKVASAPANGEHANETYFVTSRDAINQMKLFKGQLKEIAGFVLMSDGTEQSLYNKKGNTLSPAIVKLMRRNILLDEAAMCARLETTFRNVIATRTHDDCSIALLVRQSDALHPFCDYNYAEKCELYGIRQDALSSRKRVERYDAILEFLKAPATCEALSRKLHLQPQYTKKHLDHLCSLGLVSKDKGIYQV